MLSCPEENNHKTAQARNENSPTYFEPHGAAYVPPSNLIFSLFFKRERERRSLKLKMKIVARCCAGRFRERFSQAKHLTRSLYKVNLLLPRFQEEFQSVLR